MSFMPMGDKILVEPFDRVKSDILEVVLTEKPNRGIVVAVGPGQSNKRGGRDQMPITSLTTASTYSPTRYLLRDLINVDPSTSGP